MAKALVTFVYTKYLPGAPFEKTHVTCGRGGDSFNVSSVKSTVYCD
jgi:hypothetical protein